MTPPDLSGFGDVAILRPLTGGRRNTVFLAEREGTKVVAKSTTRSAAQVVWMADVMQAAARVGLIVPRMVQSQNGDLISAGWTLETFVDGAPPTNSLPAIHQHLIAFRVETSTLPQRPGFLGAHGLLDQSQGGDVDLSRMPEDLVALCRAAWRAVSHGEVGVVHGDLNRDNLMITSDGRVAVLDWDECRRDLVLFDDVALEPAPDLAAKAAHLAWETAACWQTEPEYAREQADSLRLLLA